MPVTVERRSVISVAAAVVALAAGPAATAAGADADDAARVPGRSNTFNGSTAGWSSVSGSWALNSGAYWARGQPGHWTSTKHTGTWRNFVYQARVKRHGDDGGGWANSMVIHGSPGRLIENGDWAPSYHFSFSNTGYFSVYVTDRDGNVYPIQDWTYAQVIFARPWTTVKVVAQNRHLSFAINGRTVWSGRGYGRMSGRVGYAFASASDSSTLRLDSASLRPRQAEAKVTLDPPAELGATILGGSVTRSPR